MPSRELARGNTGGKRIGQAQRFGPSAACFSRTKHRVVNHLMEQNSKIENGKSLGKSARNPDPWFVRFHTDVGGRSNDQKLPRHDDKMLPRFDFVELSYFIVIESRGKLMFYVLSMSRVIASHKCPVKYSIGRAERNFGP